MKINYYLKLESKPVSLQDFADKYGLELNITERENKDLPRFYASFSNVEIKNGSVLSSCFGDGNTIEKAILDYVNRISEKLIVIDAFKPSRREIKVPKLFCNVKEILK